MHFYTGIRRTLGTGRTKTTTIVWAKMKMVTRRKGLRKTLTAIHERLLTLAGGLCGGIWARAPRVLRTADHSCTRYTFLNQTLTFPLLCFSTPSLYSVSLLYSFTSCSLHADYHRYIRVGAVRSPHSLRPSPYSASLSSLNPSLGTRLSSLATESS